MILGAGDKYFKPRNWERLTESVLAMTRPLPFSQDESKGAEAGKGSLNQTGNKRLPTCARTAQWEATARHEHAPTSSVPGPAS